MFTDLGLSQIVLDAVNKKGFEEPTAIQSMTIPVMLRDDTNIIAQAQTGTGKTAAFGLPLIDMINTEDRAVQALILVPTRELAIQVSEEIHSLRGERDLKIVPIYGGQSIDQQLRRLKKGVHIVVGTPGRVIDHLNRKTLKLGGIEHLILDEADEMLNMGFIEDMEEIMQYTPETKRTLLFSATMPQKIKALAKKYMDGYELITAKKEQLTTNLTEQIYFEVKGGDKFEALCRIIDMEDEFFGLIFCRTKNDADGVAAHLIDRGYDAEPIHGDISQAQRERTLDKFKRKRINILVATDVAARGIDVSNLTHVINYSLPQDPDAYVHRIGRTGRAGKEGTAITFITPSEYRRLMFIQRMAKADIKKSTVPKVKDVIKAKKRKIYEELSSILDGEIDEKYKTWAAKLLEDRSPEDILAAVLNHSFEAELNPGTYGEIQDVSGPPGRDNDAQRGGGSRGRGDSQLDRQGKTRLFVALGRKDKIDARKLVELVLQTVPMDQKEISDVQVMDNFSFITVPFDKAEKVVIGFRAQGKGQKPLITRAKGGAPRGRSGGSSGGWSGKNRRPSPKGGSRGGYKGSPKGSPKSAPKGKKVYKKGTSKRSKA
ncbi:MAG: DEAD/DEAH box helicase [Spirochaetia bacterium]|nr:DEAD/DEAH box helicase [Spirochaetia bacterium]